MNHKIIKLTCQMFNQFRPDLNELILGANEDDGDGSECGISNRNLHTSHLTKQVEEAFTLLAAELIGAFERCVVQTELMDVPTEADTQVPIQKSPHREVWGLRNSPVSNDLVMAANNYVKESASKAGVGSPNPHSRPTS